MTAFKLAEAKIFLPFYWKPCCHGQEFETRSRQYASPARMICTGHKKMFNTINSVHFVGICGTAMASAAAAMREKGFSVTGSDQNVYPPMSTFLAERKIEVISGFAEHNLAHRPDLVVIGNAISRG